MSAVRVYSRRGCHLCEVMIEELMPLIRGRAELEVLDIDTRPEWRERYDTRVPVLAVNDQEICDYRLDPDALQAALAEADEGA